MLNRLAVRDEKCGINRWPMKVASPRKDRSCSLDSGRGIWRIDPIFDNEGEMPVELMWYPRKSISGTANLHLVLFNVSPLSNKRL